MSGTLSGWLPNHPLNTLSCTCFSLFKIAYAMKTIFLSIATIFVSSLSAQVIELDEGVTRAVVIGISDYADERIPDLQYAHRDAEAFIDYLRSPAGGSMPESQIMLLTNEEATLGKIVAALDWLIAKSQHGDKAIIYFSGHGDVEKVTKFNMGYLLAHDAPGTTYMGGGSLNVRDLQSIVATLSDTKIQVIMISDACRAGKLAGSETGGTQQTATELARQLAHEIKILSCQPSEFSIEGEQWGGGRGCFSYHLTEGLTGLADVDNTRSVDLSEIGRYLQDRVKAEVAPQRQMPMTIGDAYTTVSLVNEAALADLQQRKEQEKPTILATKSKGMENLLLTNADTSVQELYRSFTAALERSELMSSTTPGGSANDYFERLMQQTGIEDLQGMLKRNFAAALQDEAQLVVNKLLRTDPQIVDDAFAGVKKYDHIPGYLARAAEILGEQHYMYRYLKAKQHYFTSKTIREDTYPNLPADSLLNLALASLDSALRYDSMAAYVHLEKALKYYRSNRGSASFPPVEKALELSPSWVLANYYKGRILQEYFRTSGREFMLKAIALDSLFLPAYRQLAAFEKEKEKWHSAYILKMQEYQAKNPGRVPVIYYHYLSEAYFHFERLHEAKAVLLKADSLAQGKNPFVTRYLGSACMKLRQYKEAEKYNLKAIKLDSFNVNPFLVLPRLYSLMHDFPAQKRWEERSFQLFKSIWEDDKTLCPESWMVSEYLRMGLPQEAEPYYKKYVALDEKSLCGFPFYYYYNDLGWIYFFQGKLEEAQTYFQKSLESDSFDIGEAIPPAPHVGLALIAHRRGETAQSRQFFQAAWEQWYKPASYNCKDADCVVQDGLFLFGIYGLLDETELLFTEALEQYPDHAPLHYHLGRIYLEQKNDYAKGVPLLERSVALDSSFPDASYHLAAAYAHLGKKKAALENLEQALEKGYADFEEMRKDARWEGMRGTKRYGEVMKKYLPLAPLGDYHKD